MNFEHFLYQYLLKNGKAEVPDFGIFELAKESAKIDAEHSVIIPPKEILTFEYQPKVFGNHFAKYIAEKTNSNLFVVQMNMKNEIADWFSQLRKNNLLTLENLGQYQLDKTGNIVKITDSNPNVFGLETINIQNLQSQPKKKKSSDYKIGKTVFWTFLILIILGGIAFYFSGGKELLLKSR